MIAYMQMKMSISLLFDIKQPFEWEMKWKIKLRIYICQMKKMRKGGQQETGKRMNEQKNKKEFQQKY